MEVDIYTSATDSGKHLVVPARTDFTVTALPGNLDADLHKVHAIANSVTLNATDNRVAMDSADVIRQINEKGFAVFESRIIVTIVPAD